MHVTKGSLGTHLGRLLWLERLRLIDDFRWIGLARVSVPDQNLSDFIARFEHVAFGDHSVIAAQLTVRDEFHAGPPDGKAAALPMTRGRAAD
jgi:hypothetical protein